MAEDEKTLETRLWRRLQPESKPSGHCPDSMTLAAYLDGRLGRTESDEMEAHLAVCHDCLTTVVEVRSLALEAFPKVPRRIEERARSLMTPSPDRDASSSPSEVRPWSGFRLGLSAVRWAAMVAAATIACGLGYSLGRSAHEQMAEVQALLADECTFGLDLSRPRPGGLYDDLGSGGGL